MRPRRDADALHISDREGQPNANPNAVADAVVIGQPIGDRDRQRVADAMSIAVCDGVPIAERQPEAFVLALGPRQQSVESVQE